MGVVIAIVAVIVVVAIAVAVVAHRRRSRADGAAGEMPSGSVLDDHPDPGPMTGLEDALNRLTDTSGQTMAERLDEESPSVEELRIPDDTGPLLRRVLDSLESDDEALDTADTADSDDIDRPAGSSDA